MISTRNFKINEQVATDFSEMCKSLGLKKDKWAVFFIKFEMDFINGYPHRSNSENALQKLEAARRENPQKLFSIKMTDELISKLDILCQRHRFSRAMLVEFALRNARDRVPPPRKLHTSREDLLPLFQLEHSFKHRVKTENRWRILYRDLIVGRY